MWRLLIDGALPADINMARDEAIAVAHARGATPPTLRLYRWRPAALSLGRFQRAAEIDRARCAQAGIAIVRRPSGGRALLHDAELTYAVVARADHALLGGASLLESYRRISLALLAGLRRLGVQADLTPVARHERRRAKDQSSSASAQPSRTDQASPSSTVVGAWPPGSAACFDTAAAYELTVAGRKLVGSAQTRRDGVLLQHGAIPLAAHADRLAALLQQPPADLGAKMIALDQALGRAAGFDELAAALLAGFAETWGAAFVRGELTAHERELEQQLRAEKYADDGWTYGR